jgi:hypothetical protein
MSASSFERLLMRWGLLDLAALRFALKPIGMGWRWRQ